MLGKLIKYDMKALARILLPAQLGVIAAALLGGVFLAITIALAGDGPIEGVLAVISTMLTGLYLFLLMLGIVAAAVISLVFIAMRFYKSLFSNEGYLTFTLPVTAGQILLSKVITGVIWLVCCTVAVCIAVALVFLVGLIGVPTFYTGLADLFIEELPKLFEAAGSVLSVPLFAIEAALGGVVSMAEGLMQVFLAVVVGGMIAKKHKVVASIGAYLGIRFAVNLITVPFAALLPALDGANRLSFLAGLTEIGVARLAAYGLVGVSILFSAGLFAAYFFIARGLLKNKLNLQ